MHMMITDQTHREKSFSGNNRTHEIRPREWPLLNQSQTQQSWVFRRLDYSQSPVGSGFSNEHHHPRHHHHPQSHGTITAIILTDIINKQWTPKPPPRDQTSYGKIGKRNSKMLPIFAWLAFPVGAMMLFSKKVGEWSYSNQNNCKDIIWWINIQIPTNHTIARVDWTRSNHDLYESHLFTLRHILPMRWDAKRNKKQAHLANEMIST